MLTTLAIIALPILFIGVGTVAALSFARDPKSADARVETRPELAKTQARQPQPALFRPLPRELVEEKETISLEEMVASVEAHLRNECEAAKVFIHRPSAEALWIN